MLNCLLGTKCPNCVSAGKRGEVVFAVATTDAIRVKWSFFPDHDLVHPCHQEVTASRRRGGVQFLTRSHRTALSESQVGSCATRHHYTLDVSILSRAITSADTPGGLCGEYSFCYTENSANSFGSSGEVRTPVSALKGPCLIPT